MAFSVNSSFCDLCCQPVRKGRRKGAFNNNMEFPGCDGLPSVLNKHLVVYFIVKKLLDLKDEQVLELMVSGDGGRDNCNCFCDKCEGVVVEAFEMHLKVVDFQRNIQKLGDKLKELLKLSWRESDNESSSLRSKEIAGKIRKFMDNKDLTDKTIVKTEQNPVKAEIYDGDQSSQEDLLEEDSVMDDFSNTQSDHENDSVPPNPETDKEEETIPSKRRRKRINLSDDEKDNASDDSDYKPEEETVETKSCSLERGSKRKSVKRKRGSRDHRTSASSGSGNTCQICGMFQKTPNGFRNHMNIHKESTEIYGNKYDCPKCKYPTTSEFKLRYHMTKAHQDTHNNTCSVCGFVGSRRHIYEKHMLEKHDIQVWTPIDEPKVKETETKRPYRRNLPPVEKESTCHICGTFQKTAHGFRSHMSVHEESTNKYGNKYDCPKCKYPTLSEGTLRFHMTKAHQATHNNTCTICGFVGSRRWNYDKHMMDKHDIQVWKPIDDPKEKKTEIDKPSPLAKICNICGMVQKSPNGFRNHMIIHKESTEVYGNKYDCPKCKYPTISESKLRYHMTKAHQETCKNTCSLCGFVGSRRHIYDKHMLDKHGIQAWTPIDDPKVETNTDEGKGMNSRNDKSLMFQCERCTAFYKTAEAFERHQNTHKLSSELDNKFDCDLCGFPTISEKLLGYHKRRVHQPHFMHTCSICDHKVKRFSLLKMHMQKYHKHVSVEVSRKYRKWSENRIKDGRYQCKLCDYLYADAGSLWRHMQEHEKSSRLDDKWKCQKCKFPCSTEERLRRHMIKKHEENSPSTCTICQKTFCRPNLLKVHMIVHQKHDQTFDRTTGLFLCTLCDFKVTTLRGLETHISSIHRFTNTTKEAWKLSHDSYICPQCGRSFLNKMTLRKHVRTIHEGKYTNRYRCEVCGTGFEAKCFLERHLKTHNPNREKEFVCEICGAAYTGKATLTQHTNKFHLGLGSSSAIQKTLNCKFCGDQFPYKHLLDNHLRKTHEAMFTFRCDLCDKSYISGSSLRLHKEIHHSEGAGAGTHACEYCEKEFPHKHNVLNHYRYCAVKKKLQVK